MWLPADSVLWIPGRVRPPPRSALVPYTTLFRSDQSTKRGSRVGVLGTYAGVPGIGRNVVVEDGVTRAPEKTGRLDRKSTRLNSSHGYISYAVFCLKTKDGPRADASPFRASAGGA